MLLINAILLEPVILPLEFVQIQVSQMEHHVMIKMHAPKLTRVNLEHALAVILFLVQLQINVTSLAHAILLMVHVQIQQKTMVLLVMTVMHALKRTLVKVEVVQVQILLIVLHLISATLLEAVILLPEFAAILVHQTMLCVMIAIVALQMTSVKMETVQEPKSAIANLPARLMENKNVVFVGIL